MTRLVGFLLLQLAAALYAARCIADSLNRTQALDSYCNMLEHLRGLLESDGSPMPTLLERLSGRTAGDAQAFINTLKGKMDSLGEQPFQKLWHQALLETAYRLDDNARRELESLGTVLGRYDSVTQLDALDMCHGILRRRLTERQQGQAQDTRVTVAMSLSVSLLAGIILI